MSHSIEDTEDFDVYATWIARDEDVEQLFCGSVDLPPKNMPDELEINGETYLNENKLNRPSPANVLVVNGTTYNRVGWKG